MHAQAAGGRAMGKNGTPIQALPPPSQLDAAVLDALPLGLKRELERAYGARLIWLRRQQLSAGRMLTAAAFLSMLQTYMKLGASSPLCDLCMWGE